MSGEVSMLVGGCLPGHEMRLYDKQLDQRLPIDWTTKDRGFDRVGAELRRRAGAWSAFSPHIITEHTPLSNQRQAPTCVANAVADALEILLGLVDPAQVKQLSRRFIYRTARVLTGDEQTNTGTYIRAAMHQLRKVGVPEEQYFPYSDQKELLVGPGAAPQLELYTMASANKLAAFYRITNEGAQRLSDIETAVRADHPVVFGTPVGQEFCDYRGGDHTFSAPARADQVGRHAMIITGVDYTSTGRRWWVRNSWGDGWGDHGHVWLDDGYLEYGETDDLWVPTQMPPIL